jgi:hypothetical protein
MQLFLPLLGLQGEIFRLSFNCISLDTVNQDSRGPALCKEWYIFISYNKFSYIHMHLQMQSDVGVLAHDRTPKWVGCGTD